MRTTLLRFKWILLAVTIGISGGWAYWYFIGCSSGSCAITSNPYNSMGYGALLGLILSWDSTKKKKKNELSDTTSRSGTEN
ncbi:MAG: hypothetical protein IT233_07580 [Bacteroidia bacterium]|nr:hypothetical protein [Bacteroidia bacterium]